MAIAFNPITGKFDLTGSSSAGNTFVYGEVLSGSGNSFTLANSPVAGLYAVFNTGGQRLREGVGNDYTVSGVNITTVDTFGAGQLIADYQY